MDSENNIHLGITFDQNYVTLFYVLLTSVFHNNKQHKIIVHAIATDVNEEEKSRISQFVQDNKGEIHFYDFDKKHLESLSLTQGKHLTVATYYRLYLPGLVPDHIEKIIYLDTDIVVIGSLAELYNTDMQGKPVAAVIDPLHPARPELEIHKKGNYFNAGVLLIHLPEWKRQQCSERSIRFIQQYPERCRLNDQDALNFALADNCHPLSLKYNITLSDIPQDLKKSEYKNFLKDKVIIHYTRGGHKPWKILGKNKFRYLYHYYLKKSPRSFEPKYSDFKLKPRTLIYLTKIRAEEAFAGYPVLQGTFKNLKKVGKKFLR